MLWSQAWGKGERVAAIHGFTQSSRSWERFAAALGSGYEVVAVDAPGHGRSSEVRADLPSGAELIGRTAGRANYVGYSMGGRLALHLALARPELVSRLVLVSATAGIDDPLERAHRRSSDEELARKVERWGVPRFVEWWLSRPLFATLPPEAAELTSRLVNSPAGLASSLRLAGTGTQEPLWDRLGSLEMPVLVTAGALDKAYRQRAERLAAGIGNNASLVVIEGAGHACHLEREADFAKLVRDFLSSTEPAPP